MRTSTIGILILTTSIRNKMKLTHLQLLINSIEDNGNNTASEMRLVLNALKDEICKVGEIKMSIFTPTYLSANFDNTGLGINEMDGFAICNGDNETYDLRKRVPVGYDPATYTSGFDYSILGNQFGEENQVITKDQLPNIKGRFRTIAEDFFPFPDGVFVNDGGNDSWIGDGSNSPSFDHMTVKMDFGKGQPHNNIQPSTVVIFYQRIN